MPLSTVYEYSTAGQSRGPTCPKYNYFTTTEIVKAQSNFDKWLTKKTLKKQNLNRHDVSNFWNTPNSINSKTLNNDTNSFVRNYVNPKTYAYKNSHLYPETNYARRELKERLLEVTKKRIKRYKNEKKLIQNQTKNRAAAQILENKKIYNAQTLEKQKMKNEYAKYRQGRSMSGLALNQVKQAGQMLKTLTKKNLIKIILGG